MMNIQHKYSKTKIDYINLERLKFGIIRKKDYSLYRLNDNTKIGRNYTGGAESPIQSILFDLKNMCLLSRIHLIDQKLMKVKLEISLDEDGPFISIENDMTIISGGLRVIKLGSLPCRYLRMTILKGHTIMDFSKVECYGLAIDKIKEKFDEDTIDILFYNSYDLIYGKSELES
jgi:hypothetical protein